MVFVFRPWVRRAGLSIVAVAAIASIFVIFAPVASIWSGESSVWVYIGTLWLGGLKVWLGTFRPVAELDEERIVVRPLHHLFSRVIPWERIRGTEQMIGGDRLMLFYEAARGQRFVALNMNLVKGRRDFLEQIERRLLSMGFAERVVERSRYLSRGQ